MIHGSLLAGLLTIGAPSLALAQAPAGTIDSGDTAWVLTSTALVLMMTAPGLALFYGGMVQKKNALTTIMHSFLCMALVSVQWVVIGYSLAFGPDKGGVIGGFEWAGLRGVGLTPVAYAPTIPHQAFMMFQLMFAIITPALITGAFAERMKFSAYIVFALAWTTLVYDPVAHWVWADGGWLRGIGAIDFAGGTVVHLTSGVSALVSVLIIGRRAGWGESRMVPHSLPLTITGAGLLWFGWFGFNAGSALGANGLATSAFVATNTAAAAATLTWMLTEWRVRGTPSVMGAAGGAVAGLVAITPASGYVTPLSALVIGAAAGVVCFGACHLKVKLQKYDDSLDVVGVHGAGGLLGALLTGVFASTAINPAGADGWLAGNAAQLGKQALGALAPLAYAAVLTAVILKVIDATMGLRVGAEDEAKGLDLSQHAELAYAATREYRMLEAMGGAHGVRPPADVMTPASIGEVAPDHVGNDKR
jgi:Amt family ammonium transporter